MATYTDRIQLVFPINDPKKTRAAAASLQTLEITESGNEFEKLVPLDPSLVSQYASQFNLPLLQRVTELEADLTTKTSQLDAVTQAKTALDLRVATLTNEKQALEAAVALANQVNETLTQKVAELEQYRPYNPRILAGEAFYDRISKHDMVTLLASDDPMLVNVGKTIEAYRVNNWPVVLDSTDFQQLVSYVLQSGVFDESEVVEIMRDASREEAYRVPE